MSEKQSNYCPHKIEFDIQLSTKQYPKYGLYLVALFDELLPIKNKHLVIVSGTNVLEKKTEKEKIAYFKSITKNIS